MLLAAPERRLGLYALALLLAQSLGMGVSFVAALLSGGLGSAGLLGQAGMQAIIVCCAGLVAWDPRFNRPFVIPLLLAQLGSVVLGLARAGVGAAAGVQGVLTVTTVVLVWRVLRFLNVSVSQGSGSPG